jgi:hypothetical protein
MYVDLNPIRAGKAKTPEESRYTSAYERIAGRKRQRQAAQREGTQSGPQAWPSEIADYDLWLCPIQLADHMIADERNESAGGGVMCQSCQSNPFPSRRLTNKGFLPMTEEHYLCLLDWTGRQIRSDKRVAIPAELAPILERLHIDQACWPDLVSGFAQRFRSAVGRVDSMRHYAQRLGRRWFAGIRQAAVAFT